jgi:hypothetical protein
MKLEVNLCPLSIRSFRAFERYEREVVSQEKPNLLLEGESHSSREGAVVELSQLKIQILTGFYFSLNDGTFAEADTRATRQFQRLQSTKNE